MLNINIEFPTLYMAKNVSQLLNIKKNYLPKWNILTFESPCFLLSFITTAYKQQHLAIK